MPQLKWKSTFTNLETFTLSLIPNQFVTNVSSLYTLSRGYKMRTLATTELNIFARELYRRFLCKLLQIALSFDTFYAFHSKYAFRLFITLAITCFLSWNVLFKNDIKILLILQHKLCLVGHKLIYISHYDLLMNF